MTAQSSYIRKTKCKQFKGCSIDSALKKVMRGHFVKVISIIPIRYTSSMGKISTTEFGNTYMHGQDQFLYEFEIVYEEDEYQPYKSELQKNNDRRII